MRLRKASLFISFFALSIFAVIKFAAWPRNRSLLAQATRLVPAVDEDDYGWVSGDKIVMIRAARPVLDPPTKYELSLLDIRSGRESQLAKITDRWNRTQGYHAKLSPDGKWILWTGVRSKGERYQLFAAFHSVDERTYTETPIGEKYTGHGLVRPDDIFWMAEPGVWVEFAQNRVSSRSMPADDSLSFCAVVRRIGSSEIIRSAPFSHSANSGYVLLAAGHLFIQCNPDCGIDFDEYRIANRLEHVGRRTIRIPDCEDPPSQVWVWENAVSPDGKRIAWIVDYNRASPLHTIHKWFPFIRADTEWTRALCLCNADGTGLRILGDVPAPTPGPADIPPSTRLHWSPDGRLLSFIYKGWLWTVPAQ